MFDDSYRYISFGSLPWRPSAVTVNRISPMPRICSAARLSSSTTTPKSEAVTGSTIATMDATAGAVCLSPTM